MLKKTGFPGFTNAVFVQRKKIEYFKEKKVSKNVEQQGRVNAILQKNLRFYFEIDGTDRFLWDRL